MNPRACAVGFATSVTAVVAASLLAGCNPTSTPASPSPPAMATSTVAITAASTADTSTTATTPTATTPTATTPTATRTTADTIGANPTATSTSHHLPPGHGIGISAFAGHWQRHESELDLDNSNLTGRLLMGASAVDGETWSVTWDQVASHIVVTLNQQLAKSGQGIPGMASGQTFTAELSTGPAGTTVLLTDGLGDTGGPLTWCGSGGSSPACGA